MTPAQYKNVEDRLLEVKKHILEEPKRLDMSFWLLGSEDMTEVLHVDKEEMPACGIVGCIAGWLVSFDSFKKGFSKDWILSQVGVQKQAQKLLGYPPFISHLFFVENWNDDLIKRYENSKSKQERAIITGEAIDSYLNLIKTEVQNDEQISNQ